MRCKKCGSACGSACGLSADKIDVRSVVDEEEQVRLYIPLWVALRRRFVVMPGHAKSAFLHTY